MKLGNNKKKFGYYQVGDFVTYSKIEALEISRLNGQFPQWRFNDLEFGAYDWALEPKESLDELYARRAKQIRDTYDHVVLFFSGGADSTNMLNAFIKNNIPFDEIATLSYWQANPDPDYYFHKEQFRVSYPQIEQWQQQGVEFFHRRIDISEITQRVLQDDQYRITRAYYSNTFWGTNHFSKSFIRETTPDYQRIIESGRKLVFVWGCEKPRIFREGDRYCVKFADYTDTTVPTRTQIIDREWEYDEFFYWAPECADLICKQGHVIKNFLSLYDIECNGRDYRNNEPIELPPLDLAFTGCPKVVRYNRGLSYRELINVLVYPDWDPATYSVGKIPGVIINPNDTIWLQDSYWRGHIDRLISHLQQIDSYWHNDLNNLNLGIKSCISPAYYLN